MARFQNSIIFVTIAIFAIVGAQMPGGFQPMKHSDPNFSTLQSDAQQASVSGVGEGVKIQEVTEAQQQVVAGTNYHFVATLTNGKQCCFKAFRSLDNRFTVDCADCNCNYPQSECFK